jgi:hypothetical protein
MRLHDYAPRPAHIKWLLDSDPAIRWQVMRDLTDEAPNAIAAERSRVATEGWGAQLLARQSPAGDWGGGAKWDLVTLWSLVVLKDLGLDPASKPARKMIDRVGLSFTAKRSPASTAESSQSARISKSRTTHWPINFWANNSRMAAGTAKHQKPALFVRHDHLRARRTARIRTSRAQIGGRH